MTQQPPPRRTWRIAAITAAIAVTLAGAAGLAAWRFDWMSDDKPAAAASPTSLPVETQMECASIRREYASWNQDMPRLVTMVTESNPRDVVRHELGRLKEDGDALLKAVSGYSDQPSKELAVAVAQYNVDLSFVSLEHQLMGGQISPDKQQKAVQSAGAVQTAYKTFMQKTCGEPS